jgi:ATP-dependent DNA ligase
VRIFSRNSEDNTTKYPDIAALMPRARKASTTSAILDAEAVAVDTTTGAIRPFQVLSTRKRKEADVDDIKVKVRATPPLLARPPPLLARPPPLRAWPGLQGRAVWPELS